MQPFALAYGRGEYYDHTTGLEIALHEASRHTPAHPLVLAVPHGPETCHVTSSGTGTQVCVHCASPLDRGPAGVRLPSQGLFVR